LTADTFYRRKRRIVSGKFSAQCGYVNAKIDIFYDPVWPNTGGKFRFGNQFSGAADKQPKNIKRAVSYFDFSARREDHALRNIESKLTKSKNLMILIRQ